MRNILVLGGTRFFGKRLVKRLLQDENTQVTILTRGMAEDDFGDQVTRLTVDRSDSEALATAVHGLQFDVVYDNICYSPDDAAASARIFANRTGRYILTSSLSVYDPRPEILSEADFDPETYPMRLGSREDFNYQEGKRLAETVLLKQDSFPVAAVRFPIVLGTDDYTRRMHFHIEHIASGKPIGLPNPDALISFIRSDEAADFLYWLGFSSLAGPVNACSDGAIAIRDILSMIEAVTGKQAIILSETAEEDSSPFGIEESWVMDTAKARAAGFTFLSLAEWLPELIALLHASLSHRE
ncbi:NAD-dependent epimerase/dehydratase family protein [Paenibacillus tianjinensis]|uniref:NAD-dependent epimerase/dehydratase family protein n=1 Tax=Paenibacillus tianjinensis TaxID=2810347 RepID=A0ABX7LFA1_9BACL|nr:NAD-dependent epimerase/dehydratase family protein [Paenibacillus tianjinensis]QSF46732.1 NAD-dependent epimerase/dehydratase family protein [Paenibacillus tianjinensis]